MYCMDFYREFFVVPQHEVRVFILIDGLGMNLMHRRGDRTWLSQAFQREMRSVYPSTTAIALSCIASLREPGELGISGWTTYLPEPAQRVEVLRSRDPFAAYREGEEDPTIVPKSIVVPSFLADGSVTFINPAPFVTQCYARWVSGGDRARRYGYRYGDDWDNKGAADHWCEVAKRALTDVRAGDLVYLYLPQVDAESHKSGWDSDATAGVLATIDRDLADLESWLDSDFRVRGVQRCRLAVTADHGLINIPRERYFSIRDDTGWYRHLVTSPSGEGRNPVFHVRPGAEEAFVRDFEGSPEGACYSLYRPEELVERNLFPEPGISREARPRWGTFVGLATERAYLEDRTRGQKARNFVAVHGGDDPDERRVPLFRRDYEL